MNNTQKLVAAGVAAQNELIAAAMATLPARPPLYLTRAEGDSEEALDERWEASAIAHGAWGKLAEAAFDGFMLSVFDRAMGDDAFFQGILRSHYPRAEFVSREGFAEILARTEAQVKRGWIIDGWA